MFRLILYMNLETICIKELQHVGAFIRAHAFNQGVVEWKGTDDPVTSVDKQAEHYLREGLAQHVDASFVGEEHEDVISSSPVRFYIDPIDGTKSFLRKEFLSSLSLAVEENGELTHGFVYDFMKDILYAGTPQGSYLLFAGKKHTLPLAKESFSKPTFSYDGKRLEKLHSEQVSLRQASGSIALVLSQLTTSYDGLLLEPRKTGVYDVAGGYVVLRQAGYVLTDFFGKSFDYKKPDSGLLAYSSSHAGKVLALRDDAL